MKKENKKNVNPFIAKFRDNKLYLISFIITLCVLSYLMFFIMKHSDGIITKRNKKQLEIIENIKKAKKANDGYYTHNVTLNKKVDIGTCTIDSYSYIFEVKEGIFTRYFSNNCLGVVKLGEETNINVVDYSFTTNNITYNKDASITSLIESNNSSVSLYFYTDSIVMLSDVDLVLINNNKVSYINSENYINDGGNLSKRYYESENDDTFNFIVFYNKEEVPCYNDLSSINGKDKLYDIYQIHYNNALGKFDSPKLMVSRINEDYCLNYENDIDILKQ